MCIYIYICIYTYISEIRYIYILERKCIYIYMCKYMGGYRTNYPKGPGRYMADTWALEGLIYHDFGAYVYTIVLLGPLGL